MRITASPIGPQPITSAGRPLLTEARRTACQATASGSVKAARSTSTPRGTAKVNASCSTVCSARPPGASAWKPIMRTLPWSRRTGSAVTSVPGFHSRRVPGP